MSKRISADLRVGGLGDIWMRLVGFHAVAALRPDMEFALAVPGVLEAVSRSAFGDRLEISREAAEGAVCYSVRGLRDLVPQALGGRRFAAPYGRAVIKSWNRWSLRDRVNALAYWAADCSGFVYSPPWDSLEGYQGYSEVVLIPRLRDVSRREFHDQVAAEHDSIAQRVADFASRTSKIDLKRAAGGTIIFPTGTGRQFIPIGWAAQNFPEALFAIHENDSDLPAWRASGLQTVVYSNPGSIAALGAAAGIAITTDSFPSHVLQYSGGDVVVLITGTEMTRVISPGFKGRVVDAVAPCHPCPHLERRGFPRCKAGLEVCLNWESPEYTNRILEFSKRRGRPAA
jgi:hypothetical protein